VIVLTIIVFILVFGLIVFVHELGHFLMAKQYGVEVEEFAFGLPPRLIGRKKGNTLYAINLIPLGGYVRLRGENEDDVSPGSFSQKSAKSRAIILAAGVLMNLILAWLILSFLLVIPPQWKASDAVLVAQVQSGSSAEQAHVHTGDVLLKMDDLVVTSPSVLHEFTISHQGQEVTMTYRQNGIEHQKKLTLAQGDAPLGVGVVSFSLAAVPNPVWWKAPWVALSELWNILSANVVFLGGLIAGLLGSAKNVSTESVSGPVGIYGLLAQFTALGWVYVLAAVAQLSLAIAVFNILPIPALDGGRILFVFINKIFGKKIISSQIEAISHTIGFGLLMLLFVIVTFRDIVRLIR